MKYLFLIFLFASTAVAQTDWPIYNGLTNGISFGDETLDTYDESSIGSFLGSWVTPGSATVTFSVFDFTQIGNVVTVTGRIIIGSTGTLDDIAQTGNGKAPSPSVDKWFFTVQNSNGFRIRVNTAGNVLFYKVSPTNVISAVNWINSEGLTFAFSYIP